MDGNSDFYISEMKLDILSSYSVENKKDFLTLGCLGLCSIIVKKKFS